MEFENSVITVIENIQDSQESKNRMFEIPTFFFDNVKTIKIRIAAFLKTIPELLKLNMENPKTPVVENLLPLISNPDFPLNKTTKETFPYWLAYRKNISKEMAKNIEARRKELHVKHETNIDNIQTEITNNKWQSNKFIESSKKIVSIEKYPTFTGMIITRVALELEFKETASILEIFNSIVLNSQSPICNCRDYWKILTSLKVIDIDELKFDNDLALEEIPYLLYKTMNKYGKYVDIRVSIHPEGSNLGKDTIFGKDTISVFMELDTDKPNFDRQSFIDGALQVSPLFRSEYKITETSIKANFMFYPSSFIDIYVFSDMVMNDPFFSEFMNIDESVKATKRKKEENGGQPWILIHFSHPSTGLIKASILQKYVDRRSPELRNTDPKLFPEGEPYIQINGISANNKKSVEIFQKLFARFIQLYVNDYDSVVEIYRDYLNDEYFGLPEEREVKQVSEKMNETARPKGHARQCPKARAISYYEGEVKDPSVNYSYNKGKSYLKFPRDIPQDGIIYESDGKNQNYYTCINNENGYTHIGLQASKLSSSAPFLPCCFKDPQITSNSKNNSEYIQEYYDGKTKQVKKGVGKTLISNKVLLQGNKGVISKQLSLFFDMGNISDILRFGIHPVDTDSLVECVKYAVSSTETPSLRHVHYAKQHLYNFTGRQIKKMFESGILYYEYFCQLLTTFYETHVYVFRDDREKFEIVIPKFTHGYYHRNYDRCVILYENWSKVHYPVYEIIGTDGEKIFSINSPMGKLCKMFFENYTSYYILTNFLEPVNFPLRDVVAQYIDSFGKTRAVLLKDNTVLETSPMNPLPVPELDMFSNKTETIENAIKIITKYNGDDILIEKNENGRVETVKSQIGNVSVSIRIQESKEFDKSFLTDFDMKRKIARYITEYTFWFFSRYLKNGNKKFSRKTIEKFFTEKTVIGKIDSNNIPKNFTTDCGLFENDKMLMESTEMVKRLKYVIELYGNRNLKKLTEYESLTGIPNYYLDITDFDTRNDQLILQGDDSLYKWILENNRKMLIYTKLTEKTQNGSLVFSQDEPFFLKFQESVYIAQNTDTIEKAYEIAEIWETQGINIGYRSLFENSEKNPEITVDNFILYVSENFSNLNVEEINVGENPDARKKILGYRVNNTDRFTVLLKK